MPAWCAARHQELPPEAEREWEYFEMHRDRLHCEAMAARGCPNGSGAMESFCRQFGSVPGLTDLLALEVSRRNPDWNVLWFQN